MRKPLAFLMAAFSMFLSSCLPQKSSETIDSKESTASSLDSASSYPLSSDGFALLPSDYFAYKENAEDFKKRNEVYVPPLASSQNVHYKMRLFVAGEEVPVYRIKTNLSNIWDPIGKSRRDDGVASLFLKGQAKFQLQLNFNSESHLDFYPKSRKVSYHFDKAARVLAFTILTPGQYVLEMFGGLTLHLFVEDLEAIQKPSSSMIIFEKGVHNRFNDPRIGADNYVNLSSGQIAYLMPGAIVQGGFRSVKSSGVGVMGLGFESLLL